MRRLLLLLTVAAGLATPASAAAQLRFQPIDGSYVAPIYLTAPPRDASRVFVVERGGLVKVVADGSARAQPFIDLTDVVSTDGERREDR